MIKHFNKKGFTSANELLRKSTCIQSECSRSKAAGFTIVETLVAIGILVVAVQGAFTAVQGGLSSTTLSKEGIVAFYLAQEGIEKIRNLRDENGLNGASWLTNIANPGNPCAFGKSCTVDAVTNTLASCSGGVDTCPVLRKDSNGFYGYNSSWGATQYTRAITLSSINADEVSILVTVKWTKGTLKKEFKARENILNWQ